MFAYYLQLGLRSLRRNPVLTALMVLGIALGIAASMTTLTVMHLMGSDPIPWKSDKLALRPARQLGCRQSLTTTTARPPDQVTYRDAIALMAGGQGRQAGGDVQDRAADPAGESRGQAIPRARSRDLFATSSRCSSRRSSTAGRGTKAGRRACACRRTDADTNEKLFGGQNSVGKTVRMDGIDYKVVGVLDDWKLRVKLLRSHQRTLSPIRKNSSFRSRPRSI